MAFDPRRIPPTKINLIRLRREYAVIKKIRRVLEEKREVLLLYIRSTIGAYEEAYREAMVRLNEAYEDYYRAISKYGYAFTEKYADSVEPSLSIEFSERALFAIKVPVISIMEESIPRTLLPPSGQSELVTFRQKILEALPYLMKAIQSEITLRRLIAELKNTQRLINAVDHAIIPFYERSIKFIKVILEERMREEFVRLKTLKRKLEKRR